MRRRRSYGRRRVVRVVVRRRGSVGRRRRIGYRM